MNLIVGAGESRVIASNQEAVHTRLVHTLARHVNTPYLKPFQIHNCRAFDRFVSIVQRECPKSLILDSCCGTGMSTRLLASENPDSLVIGIDRSTHRLQKGKNKEGLPENTLFLRASCEDFWRLCELANIRFDRHTLFYPNPYPKAEHLKRRWHGHPVFPSLQKISERLTLRSNWRMYLDEFSIAWEWLTGQAANVNQLDNALLLTRPVSLFERKYANSAQVLYELDMFIDA